MAKGKKTGGRVAGTPNKRTEEVAARLAALECDPIEGMARIAMDPDSPVELRGRMFAELAQYVAPKRRALDVAADQQRPVTIRIGIPAKNPEPRSVESTSK